MRTLLLRLSALDAEAEGAVRVISVFDALVSQHAGIGRLARVTAQLAECPVGVSDPAGGVLLRCTPDGRRLGGGRPAAATGYPVDGGGEVWLERSGPALALDDIVGERFAAAAAIVRDMHASAGPRLGDPALIELAISHSAEAPERSRALHLMGLTPATQVRVLAVAGDVASALAPCADLLGHAPVQDLHAALTLGGAAPKPAAGPGTRVGSGRRYGPTRPGGPGAAPGSPLGSPTMRHFPAAPGCTAAPWCTGTTSAVMSRWPSTCRRR